MRERRASERASVGVIGMHRSKNKVIKDFKVPPSTSFLPFTFYIIPPSLSLSSSILLCLSSPSSLLSFPTNSSPCPSFTTSLPRLGRRHIPRLLSYPQQRTIATHTRKSILSQSPSTMSPAQTSTNGAAPSNGSSKFDPNFTKNVINLMSPETKPRHREIFTSLITHMHDFIREVELTQDEWVLGVKFVNEMGQAYRSNRNDVWRLCDILGIES